MDGQTSELDYSYISLFVRNNHAFNCGAPEKIFLHDYVREYFQDKSTHPKISINTQIAEDMDVTSLNIEDQGDILTRDIFIYKEGRVLVATTTVCASQTNKPFIALEF